MENELWLTRDNTDSAHYNVCTEEDLKAGVNSCGMYRDFIANIEAKDFHRLFPGQSLRKGRKRKIKRILIELED